MSTEEKNIAIAEIIGGWYESNNQPNPYWEGIYTDKPYTYTKDLKFHSDANWQFEVIDWIETQKDEQGYRWRVDIYLESCSIQNTHNFSNTICVNSVSKKEAIFEALYQFSQYLKYPK